MQSGKRLLVVDDDVDFADSLADLLRADGLDVTVAYDGAAAVELVSGGGFDLALVDVQMPGMNGVESLIRIRELRPKARIIMMTGYSMPELLDRAVAEGASGVMYKPLDFDRIRDAIANSTVAPVVLLVDDDQDFVDSLRGILEGEGYSVMAAVSGTEALERASIRKPDVLLLDLRMPGMSGLEAYAELRRRGDVPPTIILSAYLEEERERLQAFSDLAPEFMIDKHVDPKQLLALVQRVATV